MKVLSLKLADTLDRKLTALVEQRGISKSDVVREALVQYLGQSPTPHQGSVLDLAGDLVGCVKDAPKDLSSNPQHLADFGR